MYPPLAEEMEEEVLQELDIYVSYLHNTVLQFTATSPFMDPFLVAERRPESLLAKQWWDQKGFFLEGMRTVAREAEREEVEEDTDGKARETGK